MVNLETAVTTRGTAEPKLYLFRAPPTAFDAVKAAGLDLVSLGNNHTLDYGRVGLADTLAAADAAGVPTIGAGPNEAAAYMPWVTTVKGIRVAFLAFSQVNELASTWVATDTRPGVAMAISQQQIDRASASVRMAKAIADVVVVFMHWGQERNTCPIALQRTAARAFADAGATMIIGTHAHVLQGDGWLGQTYVAYGLSNFIWYINSANRHRRDPGDPVRFDRRQDRVPAGVHRPHHRPADPVDRRRGRSDRGQARVPARLHRPRLRAVADAVPVAA